MKTVRVLFIVGVTGLMSMILEILMSNFIFNQFPEWTIELILITFAITIISILLSMYFNGILKDIEHRDILGYVAYQIKSIKIEHVGYGKGVYYIWLRGAGISANTIAVKVFFPVGVAFAIIGFLFMIVLSGSLLGFDLVVLGLFIIISAISLMITFGTF